MKTLMIEDRKNVIESAHISDDPAKSARISAELLKIQHELTSLGVRRLSFPAKSKRDAEQNRELAKLDRENEKLKARQELLLSERPKYRYSDEIAFDSLMDDLAWTAQHARAGAYESFERWAKSGKYSYAMKAHGSDVAKADIFRELASEAYEYIAQRCATAHTIANFVEALTLFCSNIARRTASDLVTRGGSWGDSIRDQVELVQMRARFLAVGGVNFSEHENDSLQQVWWSAQWMLDHNAKRDSETVDITREAIALQVPPTREDVQMFA